MSAAVGQGAAASLVARRDRIDVWSASLDVPAGRLAALAATLARDEVERAAGMLSGGDRWRASRGLLREILARYVGGDPAAIAFSRRAGGKLALAGPGAAAPAFNLSHSGALLLVAVGRDRRVGIDVERIRAASTGELVGARYLAAAERAALAELPADRRPEAFAAVWARKEAFLKATGAGIAGGLCSFAVSVDPGATPRLLAAPAGEDAAAWTLLDVEAPRGYRAALAADGPAFAVRRRQL